VSRDEATYGQVRGKYDAWRDRDARGSVRTRVRHDNEQHPQPSPDRSDMSRLVFAGIGFGIGVVLLGLAAYAFSAASYWGSFGRDGAQVGYSLVGFFLLVAGIGGIAAVYNHNFRVLVNPPEHH